jgi:hypothetical protein
MTFAQAAARLCCTLLQTSMHQEECLAGILVSASCTVAAAVISRLQHHYLRTK